MQARNSWTISNRWRRTPATLPEAARSLSSRLREAAQETDHEVRGLAPLHKKSPNTQVQTTKLRHTACRLSVAEMTVRISLKVLEMRFQFSLCADVRSYRSPTLRTSKGQLAFRHLRTRFIYDPSYRACKLDTDHALRQFSHISRDLR